MARGVARYLVGSFVVLGLAACGKMMFAERDAWRHEAEIACLKTGQVKESASLARIQPISGPGICGADFPLKVAAIGEGSAIGFADELRPPGGIPGAVARQPLADAPYTPRVSAPPYQAYPQPQYPQPQYQQPYPASRSIRRSARRRGRRRCRSTRRASRSPNPRAPRTTSTSSIRRSPRNAPRPMARRVIRLRRARRHRPIRKPFRRSNIRRPNRCRSGASARR